MKFFLVIGFVSILGLTSCKQPKTSTPEVNDSNTPLHLLDPDYKFAYKEWNTEEIKQFLDRIYIYLDKSTPTRVIDKESGKEILDYTQIDQHSQLEQGDFRLASYEWGVTYTGMIEATRATGDKRYQEYVTKRLRFLVEMVPHFSKLIKEYNVIDGQMRQIIQPRALDDAGAMCAAMIKLNRIYPDLNCNDMIDNYMDFIENKEHRLADGTFARMRPQANTLWLDDMYMAIPALAQMGAYTARNGTSMKLPSK